MVVLCVSQKAAVRCYPNLLAMKICGPILSRGALGCNIVLPLCFRAIGALPEFINSLILSIEFLLLLCGRLSKMVCVHCQYVKWLADDEPTFLPLISMPHCPFYYPHSSHLHLTFMFNTVMRRLSLSDCASSVKIHRFRETTEKNVY